MAFALVSFALVVGLGDGVGAQGGEGGQEHGAFEPLVAAVGECSPRIDEPERRVTGARPA